jgi:chaperonin cofactor prefoldin
VNKLKKAFGVCQFVVSTQAEELELLEDAYEKKIKTLTKQLVKTDNSSFFCVLITFFLQESTKGSSNRGERNMEFQITELEKKNEELQTDVKELESKIFDEQRDKDKVFLFNF